jgi:hypothetical protein
MAVISRICKLHIQISNIHMCVVPGPASQVAVIKRVFASPGLQCSPQLIKLVTPLIWSHLLPAAPCPSWSYSVSEPRLIAGSSQSQMIEIGPRPPTDPSQAQVELSLPQAPTDLSPGSSWTQLGIGSSWSQQASSPRWSHLASCTLRKKHSIPIRFLWRQGNSANHSLRSLEYSAGLTGVGIFPISL